MTTFDCEAAALADAVGRAARIAPNKGAAFDKAAGIVLDLPNSGDRIYVKATNLEVTFLQKVQASVKGDLPATWRLPASLLSGVLAGFPLGAGQNVHAEDEDGAHIIVNAGKQKAQMRRLMSDAYPTVKPFDPSGMATVDDLAARVAQAAWSVSKDYGVLTGVHVNGEEIIGCDGYSAVMVPCKVPVDSAITVPLSVVGPLLRNVGPVQMRVLESRLELMIDADTQITCNIFAQPYPDVKKITRSDFAGTFKVGKDSIIEAINRMLVLVRGERYPKLRVQVDSGELNLSMEVSEVGRMDDTIPIEGGSPFVIWITPQRLIQALDGARQAEVTVSYGPKDTIPLNIKDDAGYSAWVMPHQPQDSAE